MKTCCLRRGGVAWTPANLPRSLVYGFLDAEAAHTITDAGGGAVSSWGDVFSGAAFVQATGAARPVWSAAAFNGRPGVAFDQSASQYLRNTGSIWPLSGAFEVWAVCGFDAVDALNHNIVSWPVATAGAAASLSRTTLGAARFLVGNGSSNVNSDAGQMTGRHVVRGVADGSTTLSYLDGVSANAPSPCVPALSGGPRNTIGASAAATADRFWHGVVNLILVTALLPASIADDLHACCAMRRDG